MSAPEIRGVNHVGITVPDIEAAKAFLIEAFGGQLLYQSFGPQDPPRQGPEFERAVGAYPGSVVRAQAMLKIGTGPDIELFEMHGPEQAQPIPASDFGITHFALYTDDIDASVARFEKAGGKPLTAPRAIPYATEKGQGQQGLLLPDALGHDGSGIHHHARSNALPRSDGLAER